MPPADVDDAWSDSDDELDADVETAVQLGLPDGPLLSPAELSDPTVSRLGGHPVRCPFAYSCTRSVLITALFNLLPHLLHLPSLACV